MKKLITALIVIALIVIAAFALLLSQSSPDKAPSGEIIVDLTPAQG